MKNAALKACRVAHRGDSHVDFEPVWAYAGRMAVIMNRTRCFFTVKAVGSTARYHLLDEVGDTLVENTVCFVSPVPRSPTTRP